MKEITRCKDCVNYVPIVGFDRGFKCRVFEWFSEPDDGCTFESEDKEKEKVIRNEM